MLLKPRLSETKFERQKLMRFWEQLHMKFMQSESNQERIMILKCMILIYQTNASTLYKL